MRQQPERVYAPTWQEGAEALERVQHGALFAGNHALGVKMEEFRVPAWPELLAESIAIRRAFVSDASMFWTAAGDLHGGHGIKPPTPDADPVSGRDAFRGLYVAGGHSRSFGTITPPPPEAYSPANIQHFQFLPSVERIKTAAVRLALDVKAFQKSPAMAMGARMMGARYNPAAMLDGAERDNITRIVRAEYGRDPIGISVSADGDGMYMLIVNGLGAGGIVLHGRSPRVLLALARRRVFAHAERVARAAGGFPV